MIRNTAQPNSFVKELMDYLERREGSLHHAMPGAIHSYDASTCSAQVVPLIKRLQSDLETNEEFGVLNDVKVVFPSSSDSSITFPIKRGDPVLVIFSDYCIDEWRASGGTTPVATTDGRQHHLSDAFCIPGCSPTATANLAKDQNSLVVKYKDSALQITADGTVKIGTESGEWKALATEDFITAFFNTFMTLLSAHTHPVPALGTSSPSATLIFPNNATYVTTKTKGN